MSQRSRAALVAAAGAVASSAALAHISYSGRDFGTIANGSSPVTISGQTVTSNFGWADASDQSLAFDSNYASWHTVDGAAYSANTFTDGVDNLYWGDSHKGRAFRFHLDGALTLTITATSNATATSVGGLAPGFSVYRGLAAIAPFTPSQTSADHDFAGASQAWRTSQVRTVTSNAALDYFATQGSWNALGDWSIGGDNDNSLSSFQYVGSKATTVHDGVASGTFALGPGDYTIFIGGNDLTSKSATDAIRAYGLALTVSAVPEPQAAWMLAGGLLLLAGLQRRRRARG